MEVTIACPKCEWEPDGRPYWRCDACHTHFDTFETTAICPNCKKQFADTQCIACEKFSPHLDWYRELDAWLMEQLEKIRERVLSEAP